MAPLIPTTTAQLLRLGGADAPAAKKSKKKLIIIVLVLVVLVGGGGAYETVLKPKPAVAKLGKDGKPGQGRGPQGRPGRWRLTITLDPVTTSIADGHVIQIALGLELVKGADSKADHHLGAAARRRSGPTGCSPTYTYKQLLSPDRPRAKVNLQIKQGGEQGDAWTARSKTEIFDVYLPTYVLQ